MPLASESEGSLDSIRFSFICAVAHMKRHRQQGHQLTSQ